MYKAGPTSLQGKPYSGVSGLKAPESGGVAHACARVGREAVTVGVRGPGPAGPQHLIPNTSYV